MTKDEYLWETQRLLSAEFSKYALGHPETDDQIPDGAEIIFQIRNNRPFNEWAKGITRKLHESGRPVILVEADDILPPLESRLVNPRIEVSASF